MQDTKEKIKKATHMFFAQKGYNASLNEIAKKVRIKTPSLYTHFDSKDELFFQVIKEEIEAYFVNLDKEFELLSKKSTHDQLSTIFFNVINYFNEKNRVKFWRNIPLIKEAKIRNKCRDLIQEKDTKYLTKILNIFNKGVENKELRPTVNEGSVFLWLAMVQGILDGMLLYKENSFDIKSYTLKTWEAFWDGIKF